MNSVIDEMKAVLDGDEDVLKHYGKGHLDGGHSGRYPWGSGEDSYQHGTRDFLGRVEQLRKEGITFTDKDGKTYTGDTAIAKSLGLTTSQFRTELSIAKNERRSYEVAKIKELASQGMGATEIGRIMGKRESSIRSLLDSEAEARMNQAKATAEFLKKETAEKRMIDVGTGVEREINISKEKLNEALYLLEREGYPVYGGGIPQATNPGKQTNMKVLCVPGTEHKEIFNYENVHSLKDYISRDDGDSYERKFNYPESLDSKRLMVKYAEDGGINKDGIIELRRGVADLSLGESRYAQVRIMVDGTHYLKGMAVYSDDLPDGVDVVFNTNKTKDVPAIGSKDNTVLKPIKSDPDNPFGSLIKDADQGGQYWYDADTGKRCSANDPNVKNKKLGLINKRADEGDWTEWADSLPSQFLSKQSLSMARKQLDLAKADKQEEFDTLMSYNNPTIKKHLLEKFADECDSAAVHLKAAALPGQKYHVIIPVNTLKDDEVYAPGYEPGTKLALIRYPHGGTFEIPILTVTHNNADAEKIIGRESIDAIGITKNVADRLSGADFDGDTVMAIPTHDKAGKVKITSTPRLQGLEGFDPKTNYGWDDISKDADGTTHYYRSGKEFKVMTKANTQKQMGVVSNLITDMTLAGASSDELAKAVRHSMVVIDAEKHKLDYKQSEIDNDIKTLSKTYQISVLPDGTIKTGGASTIISKSKGEATVLKRQGAPNINQKGKPWYDPSKPEGSLVYKTADDLEYITRSVNKKTGEVKETVNYRTQKSSNMAETDDARTLVSKNQWPMELLYADYANSMKSLANQARVAVVNTGKIAYSSTAAKTYEAEVKSLKEKVNDALLNTPREREAQRRTNAQIAKKIEENPDMSKKDIKKASQQALTANRQAVGSVSRRDRNIVITDREWEAIQAGAISETKLKQILNNTDTDALKQRAMPRASTNLSTAKINKIKAMSSSNYSLAAIAKAVGVSPSTVSKYLKGGN